MHHWLWGGMDAPGLTTKTVYNPYTGCCFLHFFGFSPIVTFQQYCHFGKVNTLQLCLTYSVISPIILFIRMDLINLSLIDAVQLSRLLIKCCPTFLTPRTTEEHYTPAAEATPINPKGTNKIYRALVTESWLRMRTVIF